MKLAIALLLAAPPSLPGPPVEEATVAQLQQWMTEGRYTAHQLVEIYTARIEAFDKKGPALHAVIELNPDALAIADALDAERKAKGPRGPLHGLPVLIKDNIETADQMSTTAGSLALEGNHAARDAFVAAQLRKAGAVILGKTNLSEWANFRSQHSTSGWSARGGQVRNPYVLDRSPCGSSSGTGAAIAANLAAVGVGTETDGSIVCPSAMNALVGVKPTLGRVSRSGIIPISHSQDTAGPMARTVEDAALVLSAIAGADPADAATSAHPLDVALKPDALKGARVGVLRKSFGYSPQTDALVDAALEVLKAQGAVLIDPVEIPPPPKGQPDCEDDLLKFEFKADLDKYLGALPAVARVHSLEDLIAFDEREKARELVYFGQDLFIDSQKEGPLTSAAYKTALANCRARAKALDGVFKAQKLDALVAPTTSPAWPVDYINGDHFLGGSSSIAAVTGFPSVTVPVGFVSELPVGMAWFGEPWSESKLLGYAYAYEQASHARKPPRFLPTVPVP